MISMMRLRTSDTWPPFPRIEVQWDEATCGQVVYLYSEIQNNFAGRPDEFIEVYAGNLAQRIAIAPSQLAPSILVVALLTW